jgi:hypothetical protein
MTMVPATATRDDQNRRISVAAAGPAISAPPENAAIDTPYTELDIPRSALISGYRGSRFAKSAPLVRNSAATATRARRSATTNDTSPDTTNRRLAR